MKLRLSLLVLLFVTPSAWAQIYSVDQVLARMDANVPSFKSLQASIQKIDMDFVAATTRTYKPDVSSGKVYIEAMRGGTPRFKMEITEPKNLVQFTLIDKLLGQVYDPNAKRVIERKISDKSEMLQLLLLGFGVSSDTIKKSYKVELGGQEVIDGKQTTVLVLTANQEGLQIPKVRLWINHENWNAVQAELTEVNRNTHLFRYTAVKLNQSIPDSIFKLNLPNDVVRG